MSVEAGAGRQVLAVVSLELRRQLRGVRLLLLAALVLLPVAVAIGMAVVPVDFEWRTSVPAAREAYARLYHNLMVGVTLFFGCLALFLNLIRGEVEARTLHYYFLAPIRRPLVVLGKYLATVAIAWAIFVPATVATVVAIYSPVATGRLLPPAAGGDLVAYGAMTALGCLAYGALFLLVGSLFRSPGLIVVLYFLWDWFEFLLPPVLKHLSVSYYVKALTPIPIADGAFALLAEPMAPWLAATRLALFAALAVALSVVVVRRMEVSYSS
jgi:ABC-type transport system involved in multi-copper enzyme maturation permease subunit